MVKKLLIWMFMILLTSGICCAKENSQMNELYKITKCNETTGVCIIRDKYLNFGLATKSGNVIITPQYRYISQFKDSDSNYSLTTKDNKTGIADKYGKIIIEPKYSLIMPSRVKGKYQIQEKIGGKVGMADIKTGHIDLEPIYDVLSSPDASGNYIMEKDYKQGVISKDFKQIIAPEYYFIMLLPGHKYYRLQKEVNTKDLYGIADLSGKIIVPVDCKWIGKDLSTFNQEVIRNGKTYTFNTQTGILK